MNQEDIKYIKEKLDEVKNIINSEAIDSSKINYAKTILFNLLEKYRSEYEETETELKLVFQNPLYLAIAKNFYVFDKKIVWIDFPINVIYNNLQYLAVEEKDAESCSKYASMINKYAPLDLCGEFEFLEILKTNNDIKTLKNKLFSIYDKIFSADDLSRFYRTLSYYYIEKRNYKIAYALCLASIKYAENKYAYDEMDYIRNKLNNPTFRLSYGEVIELLDEYNIPYKLKDKNFNLLNTIYDKESELRKTNKQFNILVSSHLYKLTKDDKYLIYDDFIEDSIGFKISIPYTWKLLDDANKKFKQNTIIGIINEHDYVMEIRDEGLINSNYNDKLNNIINEIRNEEFEILDNQSVELLIGNKTKNANRIIIKKVDNEGKGLFLVRYITTINNHIISFITPINPFIGIKNIDAFNHQQNILELTRLFSWLTETKQETNDFDLKNDIQLISQNVSYIISEKDFECSIQIPIELGGLQKIKAYTYDIKEDIRLLILIDNKPSVEEKADDWLSLSQKTAGREVLDKMSRYTINNLEIIEKYARKPGFKERAYKFFKFKNKIIVFSYINNSEISEAIDKIIATFK